jgi:hypothetical protein
LTHNDGLSDDIAINNIPILPGLHAVKYDAPSPVSLFDHQVQNAIVKSIQRLGTGTAGPGATSNADFAVFSSHTPYGLTVSADAIRKGFYTKLYGLQGERNTFWTGAAFNAHERILPAIAA